MSRAITLRFGVTCAARPSLPRSPTPPRKAVAAHTKSETRRIISTTSRGARNTEDRGRVLLPNVQPASLLLNERS
jgi:hypothetical protein